ncbi:hypothetical protein R3P38DRAFT_3180138 [Favolaschia claudopus]|uniref:Uncharacterized protein n=1 Tax=Favolaschia claudopus TaxID=2862362 RepID=A0AAW0CL89_9AGAR
MSTSAQITAAANPHQELASALSQLGALTKASIEMAQRCVQVDEKGLSILALEMAKHCVDLNDLERLPRVIAAEAAASVLDDQMAALGLAASAAAVNLALIFAAATFVQGVAPTPAEMETTFQPGNGDNQTWYVVCVGRMPGLYPDADSANAQVLGVPDQSRRKVSGRVAALAYYRQMYEDNKVMRLNEQQWYVPFIHSSCKLTTDAIFVIDIRRWM